MKRPGFRMAQPCVIFIYCLYLAQLIPERRDRGHSSVGGAMDQWSRDWWFEPAVRHYFSSNNVHLLADVLQMETHN